VLILFSDIGVYLKIDHLKDVRFKDWIETLLHGLIMPLIGTAIYQLLWWPKRKYNEFHKTQKQKLIEDELAITSKMSSERVRIQNDALKDWFKKSSALIGIDELSIKALEAIYSSKDLESTVNYNSSRHFSLQVGGIQVFLEQKQGQLVQKGMAAMVRLGYVDWNVEEQRAPISLTDMGLALGDSGAFEIKLD